MRASQRLDTIFENLNLPTGFAYCVEAQISGNLLVEVGSMNDTEFTVQDFVLLPPGWETNPDCTTKLCDLFN